MNLPTWTGTRFRMLRSDAVDVRTAFDAGSAHFVLGVFDADGTFLADGNSSPEGLVVALDALSPGSYYVRVAGVDASIAQYDLSIVPGAASQTRVFYVNDAQTDNTYHTLAPGDNANTGLSALDPKATVQAVLSECQLGPGGNRLDGNDDGTAGGDYSPVFLVGPNQPPSIESLSASPDPVVSPGEITLTASGIDDPDGEAVRVEFYRDTNGNGLWDPGDQLLEGALRVSGSDWILSGVSTAGWNWGVQTLFARAQDNEDAWSDVAVTTVVVDQIATTRIDFGDFSVFAAAFGKTRDDVQSGAQTLVFPPNFPDVWRADSGVPESGVSDVMVPVAATTRSLSATDRLNALSRPNESAVLDGDEPILGDLS